MRIAALKIENFRNIRYLEMTNIPNIVVLAGANGCGKSSVLDAIVFAKEATGAYWSVPGDPKQINVGADHAEITLKIETSDLERAYIQRCYNTVLGESSTVTVRLDRQSGASVPLREPGLHELFRTYARAQSPEIGVVEYLPSRRILTPKTVDALSPQFLDEARWKETALFSSRSRFDDIKEYLAGIAFRAAQKAEHMVWDDGQTLSKENYPDEFGEIKRVFARFFAPMQFQAVRISDNPFRYVISTPSGEIDIDDLSDGEKSVFTIAFDILRRNLRNSIILFDEPELHLHADLARRFVEILPTLREGNQFWFTTHSAEILRSVEPGSVYRIAKYSEPGVSQARQVFSDDDMRHTLADLVGEVGLVTLNKKIVFLEGSGQEIDRYILETLYAQQLDRMQFVSCGSVKQNSRISAKVLELLNQAAEFNFFYAIRDRDFMTDEERSKVESSGNGRLWVWPVYHIENFLLDWDVLLQAAKELCGPACPFASSQEVHDACLRIAADRKGLFLAQRIDLYFLDALARPDQHVNPSDPMSNARDIGARLIATATEKLTSPRLDEWIAGQAQRIDVALADDSWTRVLPGRPVLRELAAQLTVGYEQLRNVALARLRDRGVPQDIQRIINQIL